MNFHELSASLNEKKAVKEDDPCWKDYKQVGMKKKNGKDVPNCVPKEDVSEGGTFAPTVKTPYGVVHVTGRDTKGMRGKQDGFRMTLHTKDGKKVDLGSHPRPTDANIMSIVKNVMKESVDLEENKIFFVKVGDGRDSMTVKTKAANKSDALKKMRSQYPKDRVSLDRNQKQGEPAGTFESVEEARAPKIKKASMKGATASGVAGKHLKTYNITMMTDGRGVMFKVKDEMSGDIRTMNAAALAKLL